MRTKKIIIIGCILLITNMLIGCKDIAKNTIVKQIESPDNKYVAIAFLRDAGTTTAFSSQVSILKKDRKLDNSDKGNVFIGNKSKDIDIKWENSNTLIIDYKDAEKIKGLDKFEDIKIKYEDIKH